MIGAGRFWQLPVSDLLEGIPQVMVPLKVPSLASLS